MRTRRMRARPPMPKPSRQPSWLERWYIVRIGLGFYTNFSLSLEVDHPVSKQDLFHALMKLVRRQPWLTLQFYEDIPGYAGNAPGWRLSVVDRIDFATAVEFIDVDEFDDRTFETLNETSIGMNRPDHPLWRVRVYTTKAGRTIIAGLFCHSIFDGGTGLQFVRDVVSELAGESNCTCELESIYNYDKDGTFADGAIPPATDDRTNLYDPTRWELWSFQASQWAHAHLPVWLVHFWSWLSSWVVSVVAPGPLRPNLSTHPVFHNPHHTWSSKTDTRVLNFNFSPDQTRDMLQFCKNQGVTLTPFLNVAVLKALQGTLFASQPGATMSSYIAYQGRRYFPEVTQGVMVCGHLVNVGTITDPLATLRALNRHQWSAVESRVAFRELGLVRYREYSEVMESTLRGTKKSLTISNLGRVPTEHNRYRVLDAKFVSCTGASYNTILNIVSTPVGGLNTTFCYYPGFDDETVNGEPVVAAFSREYTEFCTQWMHTVD
ncbi:hypothetical protein DICA3_F06040 [Diutina catenulata]